jgi:hypothetical protein
MTTLTSIRAEIDELTARRGKLWTRLSAGRDLSVAAAIKEIDTRLEDLWHAHRAERARIRFGQRDEIIRRARAEERLERAAA